VRCYTDTRADHKRSTSLNDCANRASAHCQKMFQAHAPTVRHMGNTNGGWKPALRGGSVALSKMKSLRRVAAFKRKHYEQKVNAPNRIARRRKSKVCPHHSRPQRRHALAAPGSNVIGHFVRCLAQTFNTLVARGTVDTRHAKQPGEDNEEAKQRQESYALPRLQDCRWTMSVKIASRKVVSVLRTYIFLYLLLFRIEGGDANESPNVNSRRSTPGTTAQHLLVEGHVTSNP
jgi:hypothetical protein